MRRGLIAFDRLAAFVIGVLLIAAGAAALAWRFAIIAGDRVELDGLTDVPQQDWWPWATGAGGVLLVFLGLSWLVKHLPRRGTGQLNLTGSDETGRLTADANAAASTAGKVLDQDGSSSTVANWSPSSRRRWSPTPTSPPYGPQLNTPRTNCTASSVATPSTTG